MKKSTKENRFLNAGITYTLSNVVYKCIAFITIPIFTKLMAETEYGNVSTYLSYVTILQVIVGLSTEMSIRNAYVDYGKKLDEYIATLFILGGIVSIAIVTAAGSMKAIGLIDASYSVSVLCVLQAYATFVLNTIMNKYIMQNEYKKRSVIMVVPNLLGVALSLILIFLLPFGKDIERIVACAVSVGVFSVFYVVVYLGKYAIPKSLREDCKYALKISAPLILHTLAISVLSQFDRIMITNIRSSAETAVYSVIYNLSMVPFAITGAIQNIWLPWFTEKMQLGDFEQINKKSIFYILQGGIVSFGTMLVAPEFMKIMTPERYWAGISMIIPLVGASFVVYLYSFFSCVQMYYKSNVIVAILTTIAAIWNVIFNYLLISHYGAEGAAYATLISYIILLIGHYIRSKMLEKRLFDIKKMTLYIGGMVVACLIAYILLDYAISRWIIAVFLGCIDLIYLLKKYKKNVN